MIVSTTETIPGKQVTEVLGICRGSTVRARNVGRDMLAGLKNIVGGEITDIRNCRRNHVSRHCSE